MGPCHGGFPSAAPGYIIHFPQARPKQPTVPVLTSGVLTTGQGCQLGSPKPDGCQEHSSSQFIQTQSTKAQGMNEQAGDAGEHSQRPESVQQTAQLESQEEHACVSLQDTRTQASSLLVWPLSWPPCFLSSPLQWFAGAKPLEPSLSGCGLEPTVLPPVSQF